MKAGKLQIAVGCHTSSVLVSVNSKVKVLAGNSGRKSSESHRSIFLLLLFFFKVTDISGRAAPSFFKRSSGRLLMTTAGMGFLTVFRNSRPLN